MKEVIKEYLVSLGWKIDEQGFTSATEKINAIGKKVSDAVQGFGEALNKLTGQDTGKVVDAVKTVTATVKSASGTILIAITAVATALTVMFAKFLDGMAQADMQTQLLARRLLTTVANARSLKAVMDTMGISDLSELNEIALNPELRGQFLELRALAAQQALSTDQEQGLKNIRAVSFEFKKIGLMVNLFWARLAGEAGRFVPILFRLADVWGRIFNMIGRLISPVTKVFGLLDRLPVKFAGPLERLEAGISLIEGLISQIESITGLGSDDGKRPKADPYKRQESGLESIARSAKGIFDFLKNVWNIISQAFRRVWSVLTRIPLVGDAINALASGGAGGTPGVAGTVAKKAGETVGKNLASGGATGLMDHALETLAKNPLWQAVNGGKILARPQAKLNSALKAYARQLESLLGGTYHISSGIDARSGASDHPRGRAIDIEGKYKSDAENIALIAAALKLPATRMVNIEFSPARYKKIIDGLKKQGADLSRTQRVITRDNTGEHTHLSIDPSKITININGITDPKAVAAAVEQKLTAMAQRSTRNTQGVIT